MRDWAFLDFGVFRQLYEVFVLFLELEFSR